MTAGRAQVIALWQSNYGYPVTTEHDAGGQTSIEVESTFHSLEVKGKVGAGGFAVAKIEPKDKWSFDWGDSSYMKDTEGLTIGIYCFDEINSVPCDSYKGTKFAFLDHKSNVFKADLAVTWDDGSARQRVFIPWSKFSNAGGSPPTEDILLTPPFRGLQIWFETEGSFSTVSLQNVYAAKADYDLADKTSEAVAPELIFS